MIQLLYREVDVANQLITEIRSFIGGLIKDVQNVGVPKNKYIDAENIKLTDPTSDTLGAITVTLGNENVISGGEINYTTNADDYTGLRIVFDTTVSGTSHIFSIDGSGPLVISSALATPLLRYNDLVTKFIALCAGVLITATKYIDDPTPSSGGVKYVGFKLFGSNISDNSEIIGVVEYQIEVLKPFYGTTKNGVFKPLKSLNIGVDLYTIWTNGSVLRIIASKRDDLDGMWQTGIVLETDQVIISTDMINLIDVDGYIGFNDRVQLYLTGKGYKPRAIYFYHQEVWETQAAFIWNENPSFIVTGNPNGIYLYDSVEEETRLQLVQNYAHLPSYDEIGVNPSVAPSVQAGGALTSGNKIFTIRQLINDTASTAWGILSNPIPIFSDSLVNPNLSGNEALEITGKSITITILGLNPTLYNKYQIGILENADGVLTGKAIGPFTFTSDTQTITYYGTEPTTSLSTEELIQQQIIIEEAGNLVLNRNRLFISDVTVAVDPNIQDAVLAGTTITTQRTTLPFAANMTSVGEYQDPTSCYKATGYMVWETYRMGTIFLFKNGMVTSPYSNGNWTCDFGSYELTDSPGDVPNNIYVYYPHISMDFSGFPAIDGVPFEDAIYGFIHVRLECIPEVMSTGYSICSRAESISTTVFAWGQAQQLSNGGPVAVDRTIIGYYSPGVLFGIDEINADVSLVLRNYGQPYLYNEFSESRSPFPYNDTCILKEFEGDFTSVYQDVNITQSENIPSLSTGIKLFSDGFTSLNYSTLLLNNTVGIQIKGVGNMHVYALKTDGDVNNITGNTEQYFNYCQIIRSLVNKYGDDNQGRYISTGHFRVHNSGTTTSANVFGGDTFTQKTYSKYSFVRNTVAGNPNVIERFGLSYYSQNRINTQMRYFTGNETNLNYPYQTTSLLEWLSGSDTSVAQNDPGVFLYSNSYTPTNNVQTFQAFDATLSVDASQRQTVYYSELNLNDSPQDPNRYFLPINSKTYAAIYGSITNTFRDNNDIVILMENGVLHQQLDQQSVETDSSGTSLILGNGSVMGAREYVESNFGSPFKTGAINYLSRQGVFFTTWWSNNFRKMMRKLGGEVKDIGIDYGLASFFLENSKYISSEHQINFGYDMYSSELLASTNSSLDVSDWTRWLDDEPYSAGDIVYTNNDDPFGTNLFYKAKIAVPAGIDPAIIANQLQYWERYRNSNYTLVFNEKVNEWGQFYPYRSKLFCQYRNTVLSFDNDNSLWEHNRGNYFSWYGVQNANPYIKYVLNHEPDEFKSMRNIWVRCENRPLYGFAVGINGTKTYLEQSDFQQKGDRRYWWANIKNDATLGGVYLGGTNTTGINTLPTKRITGEIIEITIFFEGENKMNETKNTYTFRPRSPST